MTEETPQDVETIESRAPEPEPVPAPSAVNKALDTLEFYLDKADEVRWRYRAAGNNEILADSGEGYADLDAARDAAFRVTSLNTNLQFASITASGVVTRRGGLSTPLNVEYGEGLAD